MSVAGESYNLDFNTNIREQNGIGLKIKIQEIAPDVEAQLVVGMQSGSIRGTFVRDHSIVIVQYDKIIYVSLHKITEAGIAQSV